MTDPRRGLVDNQTIHYPVSDGKPMGETDAHRDEMAYYAIAVLLDHFAGTPRVYVSGNNFLYYRRGDPRAVVSPDAYVVKGVDQRRRDTFKLWEEEGHKPCFALEITSKTTREEDLGAKMMRYRDDLEVPEYFLFDLRGDWIPELLRGYRLIAGIYQPVETNHAGRLHSQELDLELDVVDGHLRFFAPDAQTPIPTRAEQVEKAARWAEAERSRADAEKVRADAAVEELERLRRVIAELGVKDPDDVDTA